MSRRLLLSYLLPALILLEPGVPVAAESTTGVRAESVVFDRTGKVELARFSGRHPDESDWRAPHFVRRVRRELAQELCGTPKAAACPKLASGEFHVISTLDWEMQSTAEKLLKAAAIAPHRLHPQDMADDLKALGVPNRKWLWTLRDYDVHNAALAAMDYQNGQVLAYAGSADAKSGEKSAAFQPDIDMLEYGWRQQGSTFKPFAYLPGLISGEMTAATLFMDVATEVEDGYWPRNNDGLERGPIRLREALRFSVNIPAVKAAAANGIGKIKALARKFGMRLRPDAPYPGVGIALGVMEVRPIDMLRAYGAMANEGVLVPQTTLMAVTGRDGKAVKLRRRGEGKGKRVIPRQAAFLMTNILASTTDRKHNPYWGKFSLEKDGMSRPAALKTGTTDKVRDTSAYGYTAPPAAEHDELPAVVAGVWMGNNDGSSMGSLSSLNTAAPLWHNFMAEVSAKWPIARFAPPPKGLVKSKIDAFSGKLPGPYTKLVVAEWFLEGTLPPPDDTKILASVDPVSGRLWQEGCGDAPLSRVFLDPSRLIGSHPRWRRFNREWVARAREGEGVPGGPWATETTFFFDHDFQPYGATWGAPFLPTETCDMELARHDAAGGVGDD